MERRRVTGEIAASLAAEIHAAAQAASTEQDLLIAVDECRWQLSGSGAAPE